MAHTGIVPAQKNKKNRTREIVYTLSGLYAHRVALPQQDSTISDQVSSVDATGQATQGSSSDTREQVDTHNHDDDDDAMQDPADNEFNDVQCADKMDTSEWEIKCPFVFVCQYKAWSVTRMQAHIEAFHADVL